MSTADLQSNVGLYDGMSTVDNGTRAGCAARCLPEPARKRFLRVGPIFDQANSNERPIPTMSASVPVTSPLIGDVESEHGVFANP